MSGLSMCCNVSRELICFCFSVSSCMVLRLSGLHNSMRL